MWNLCFVPLKMRIKMTKSKNKPWWLQLKHPHNMSYFTHETHFVMSCHPQWKSKPPLRVKPCLSCDLKKDPLLWTSSQNHEIKSPRSKNPAKSNNKNPNSHIPKCIVTISTHMLVGGFQSHSTLCLEKLTHIYHIPPGHQPSSSSLLLMPPTVQPHPFWSNEDPYLSDFVYTFT